MKKLITSAFLFLLIFSILLVPNKISAHDINSPPEATGAAEVIDVYSVFWPIVPGKTVSDPLFWAKQLKESIEGFFKFSNIDKSAYQIELSEKRLVETVKLLEDKDFANAKKSLDMNKSARDLAVSLKKKAQEKSQDVNELTLKLVKSLETQQKALAFLATQLPENLHTEVDKMVEQLTLQISEAK